MEERAYNCLQAPQGDAVIDMVSDGKPEGGLLGPVL